MLPIDPKSAATQVLAAAAGGVKPGFQATMADIWGGFIGDRIHQWRQRNLVSVLEKTADFIKQKGINLEEARALPDGELYLIFDGASKTETPDLQSLWSQLLASRMTSDTESTFLNTLVATLQRLSEIDARLLRFLSETNRDQRKYYADLKLRSRSVIQLTKENRNEWERQSKLRHQAEREAQEAFLEMVQHRAREAKLEDRMEREISKANLVNLGLITRTAPSPPSLGKPHVNAGDQDEYLSLAINHVGEQLDSLSHWVSEVSEGNEAPLWNLDAIWFGFNYDLTDLARHLLGVVEGR